MRHKRKFLLRLSILLLVVIFIPTVFLSIIIYHLNYNYSISVAEKELFEYVRPLKEEFNFKLENIKRIGNVIYTIYSSNREIPEELISSSSCVISSFSVDKISDLKEGLNFINDGKELKIFYVIRFPDNKFLTLNIRREYLLRGIDSFIDGKEGIFGEISAILYLKDKPIQWTKGLEKFVDLKDPESFDRTIYTKAPLYGESLSLLLIYPEKSIKGKILNLILTRSLIFFLLSILIGFSFLFLTYGYLQKRLKKIKSVGENILRGKILDIEIAAGDDEFGVIEEGFDKAIKTIKNEILNRERIIKERTEELERYIEGIKLSLNIFIEGLKVSSRDRLFEIINRNLKKYISNTKFILWYIKGEGEISFSLENTFGLKSDEVEEKLDGKEIALLQKLEREGKLEELIKAVKEKIIKNKTAEIKDIRLIYFKSLEDESYKKELMIFGIMGSEDNIHKILTNEIAHLLSIVIISLINEINYHDRLKNLIKELEMANRAKIDFINTISHELRTPLNSILGFTQMISMGIYGEISEEQKEALSNIANSGKRLLDLINSLLESAKLEAKKRESVPQVINQEFLINRVKEEIFPLAKEKGLDFKININIKNKEIYSDYDALNRIMINLLSNAVKYTDKGCIELKYTEDGEKIKIEVKDTGKGIPKEKIGKIFEPFESSALKGGMGLGLSITKKLVELLNGKIGVESEVGKGSRFWVEIPLNRFPHFKDTERKERKNSVLIIENNPEDIKLIKDLFERERKEVFVARSGREAYDILNRFIPEVIFVDIILPDYSGLEIIKEIRKRKEFQKTRIFVYSALEKRRIVGISRYFEKGKIDFTTLSERISKVLKKGRIECGILYEKGLESRIERTFEKPENLEIKFFLPLKEFKTCKEWEEYILKPLEETKVSCLIIFVSEKYKEVSSNINLIKVAFKNEKISHIAHIVMYLKGEVLVGVDLLISGEEEYVSREIIRELENLIE